MRRALPLIVLAGLLLAADDAAEKVKKALKEFEGTWKITLVEVGGNALAEESIKGGNFVFKDNKYTYHLGDQDEDGEVKLDPSQDPPTVDLIIKSGMDKGKTQVGIYKFEGKTLMLSFAQSGIKKRPTEFVTTQGTQEILFVITNSP